MDFITHEIIYDKLSSMYKQKEFNEEDILNWCQEVETIYIADPDAMNQYMEIPLKLKSGYVELPSNIYKLLDVYDKPKSDLRLYYNKINNRLYVPKYKGETLYINYVGTPIDEDCMPLIHSDHQPACETYCKINSFAEDFLLAKINQNEYNDWKLRFDGMIQSAKGWGRRWDNQKLQHMDIIFGDQIPRIGYMPLAHSNFSGLNTNN